MKHLLHYNLLHLGRVSVGVLLIVGLFEPWYTQGGFIVASTFSGASILASPIALVFPPNPYGVLVYFIITGTKLFAASSVLAYLYTIWHQLWYHIPSHLRPLFWTSVGLVTLIAPPYTFDVFEQGA